MLIDVGLGPLCTALPFRKTDENLTTTVRILLQPHLHYRLLGISVPAGGIRPRGVAEPSHSQCLWSTRSRHRGPGMPSHRICGQLPPSPYPVLVVSFIFAGFGNGLTDSAWNAWIGNMANADELLGFLHGYYDVGAVLSSLAATSLVTKANCPLSWCVSLMLDSL